MKLLDFFKKNYIGIGICILSICIVIIFILLLSDKVSIEMTGNEFVSINYNDNYKDEGIVLKNRNKIIKENKYKLKVISDVDTKKIGEYENKYIVTYKNKEYSIIRKVKVIDTVKPEIKVDVTQLTRDYCSNKIKEKYKVISTDNYDGDISDKVKVEEKDDNLLLTVSDSSNNVTEYAVKIVKESKPDGKIKLKGSSNVSIKINGTFKDSGYEVYDGCGNKVKANVKVEGNVDTSKKGKYNIKYSTEIDKKSISVIRTVSVVDSTKKESTTNNKTSGGTSNIGKNKIVYLTFDDGPGAYTSKVLDILDKYNVKATFFVTNQFPKYQGMIAAESKRGHTVAVHSLTHKWSIYDSVDNYINDFNKMNAIIEKQTGSKTKLFRFPGGSSNTVSRGHCKGVVTDIAKKMGENGYVYFDWNVDSGDAAGASSTRIYNNVTKGMARNSQSVVLMHDIKKNTVNTLDKILKYGIDNGYTFKPLDYNSIKAHHRIAN